MKVSYDSEQDIFYLHFKNGPSEVVKAVEKSVIVELDKSGEVMGTELWQATKRGLLKQLTEITVTQKLR
ncbi:MAG: DUF2283 domain-containing protein [Nitrososphaerales archaeon]